MFDVIWHADWSVAPSKRWVARATRIGAGFSIDAPRLVGPTEAFLSEITASGKRTLAGFDFPIGLPASYGSKTDFQSFPHALMAFGAGDWSQWFEVARDRTDISVRRPFYPMAPGGRKQAHLFDVLGAQSANDLRRTCELATSTRRAACPLFWTLGGNQVGKAAITGWKEIIRPAIQRHNARLWPFDGRLNELSQSQGLVLAETYPAEAYGHISVTFRPGMSKRSQTDRMTFASPIRRWAEARGFVVRNELARQIEDGFGGAADGEDRFDALLGLCGMLEVVSGHRAEGPALSASVRQWEGWILGQEQ